MPHTPSPGILGGGGPENDSLPPRKAWLVLWGYFDESGKFADSDFVCLCGYLADDSWEKFCTDWRIALQRHGLPFLHMSTIDWKNEKVVPVLDEFARIIRTYAVYGFSVAVDAKYYRSMPIEKRKILGAKDPRDFTFHRLLRVIRDRLHEDHLDDWFSMIFDYEEGFSVECLKSMIKLRKDLPFIKALVRHIGFADDDIFHPLQAADMFAYAYKRSLQGNAPLYWNTLTQPATEQSPGPPCYTLEYDPVLLESDCAELKRRQDAQAK
jgi:hypothetical protein